MDAIQGSASSAATPQRVDTYVLREGCRCQAIQELLRDDHAGPR
jgi:hypothetical protein